MLRFLRYFATSNFVVEFELEDTFLTLSVAGVYNENHKMNLFHVHTALKSFALLLLAAGAASAQTVVNIEAKVSFWGAYSGQGAYADAGNNYWNSFTTTTGGTNLLASDGVTSTTLSFSVSGIPEDQIGFGGPPEFAGNLLADYYYLYGTTPATFTIGGLTPGHSYEVYIYSQAGSSNSTDRAATFTLGGESRGLTAYTVDAFVEGTNYVLFHVSSIASTSLTGSFVGSLSGGQAGNEAELNGLQIVDLGATPIPEASTVTIVLGLAALGCVATRRRVRA